MGTRYRHALIVWVGLMLVQVIFVLLLIPEAAAPVLGITIPLSLGLILLAEYRQERTPARESDSLPRMPGP